MIHEIHILTKNVLLIISTLYSSLFTNTGSRKQFAHYTHKTKLN